MSQRSSPLDEGNPMWLDRLRQAERAEPSPKPMAFAKIVRELKRRLSKKGKP